MTRHDLAMAATLCAGNEGGEVESVATRTATASFENTTKRFENTTKRSGSPEVSPMGIMKRQATRAMGSLRALPAKGRGLGEAEQ